MNFASDNAAGASPAILAAVVAANAGTASAYGADDLTRAAESALSVLFEREVAAFLVSTGTAANALAIGALTPPWGATLCHRWSHLANDECGAPEFFAGGAKLLSVEGKAGKVTPSTLADALARAPRDVPRQSRPSVLSLSQATEAGTLYTLAELAALTHLARRHVLAVHMDGARFANAVVALGCTPAEMTWRAGIDVLSLGASKNGAFACEAVIFFDVAHADGFAHQRKRAGHTLAKGRFLGAQMCAWLEGEHWRLLATHANTQARRLALGLAACAGVRLAVPCEANEVFALMPRAFVQRLREAGAVFYDWSAETLGGPPPHADEDVIRLVTSFATDPADVDRFLATIRQDERDAARR